MTLGELLVEQQVADRKHVADAAQLEYREEARAVHRGGIRHAIARLLVRLGVWLDRRAEERLSRPAIPPMDAGAKRWTW
jgi:hypothetical protein